MAARVSIFVGVLLLTSCASVRSVQLQPPIPTPPGLAWGYGVEKLRHSPELSRQSAYLKAIEDLLNRGPLLISKTIEENTSVVNIKSSTRTMESRFRLRASRVLQPTFMDSGLEDGFIWVLIGTTDEDIERGWRQFLEWRVKKIEEAKTLFQIAANTPVRLAVLNASYALLEEAGAADDPTLLYYEVKMALDAEHSRIAELESQQKKFRTMTDSGELAGADLALDQALRLGLDPMVYNQFKTEVADRRRQAAHLILAGDNLFRDERYKEALSRYQHAQRLDRDNPELPTKLAMADRYDRNTRSQTLRSTVGMVGLGARILGEYFDYKREQEERKRVEAEREAIEAERAAEAQRREPRIESRRRRLGDRREPEAAQPENKPENPGVEGPKSDEPKTEPPKPEDPKVAAPNPETLKQETPNPEPPKPAVIKPDPKPADANPANTESDIPLERIRPKKKIG